MECIRPLKAGFDSDYNITFSPKNFNKELEPFAFPCRKCLACRLNGAREKAIRSIHEAFMHENNIFLTLTYDNDHVGDGKLHYEHFQSFMDKLRKYTYRKLPKSAQDRARISYIVTGEYGETFKRPHWHAILFNYAPDDATKHYITERGEQVFTSELLSKLWSKGNIEYGSVSLESAGYVARYAAKKLVHGKDQDHDYHPVHKTSSKRAIGKSFIETYYKDIFTKGYVVLPNGEKAGIPRYYEDWFKKNHPIQYETYVTTIKLAAANNARVKQSEIHDEYLRQCALATGGNPLTQKQVSMTILKQKFKKLQERLKL